MNLKKAIELLTSAPSITGREWPVHDKIISLCTGIFDSAVSLKNGSVLAVKKCGLPDAPKIMLNAHIDEIGMYVTQIHEGGFLSVANAGGIDTNILYASQVTVYGKKEIKGVFASTPPHLSSGSSELDKIGKMIIDTGLTRDELKDIVEIGTPVGLDSQVDFLLNNMVSSRGMDDKICIISIIRAVEMLKKPVDYDIYALFSSQEEVTSLGAVTGSYQVYPDFALVVDVGHAHMKGIEKTGSLKLGGGTGISYSATTSRRLTDEICASADRHGLKYRRISEAGGTGTDAHHIQLVRDGIPSAVLSVPLRNMHTACEIISLDDVESTAALISGFIKDGGYRGEEVRIVG